MNNEGERKTTTLHGQKVNIMTVLNNEAEEVKKASIENKINPIENNKVSTYTAMVNKENQKNLKEERCIRLDQNIPLGQNESLDRSIKPAHFHAGDITEPNDSGEVKDKIVEKTKETDKNEEGGRCSKCCSCLLASKYSLSEAPSFLERARYAFLCPPHSWVGQLLTYCLAVVTIWAVAYCILGKVALPGNGPINITVQGGTVFALLAMLVTSYCAGWLISKVKMPPLLGTLS